jgi:hypothetical protein
VGRLIAIEYGDDPGPGGCDQPVAVDTPPLTISVDQSGEPTPATTFSFSINECGPARLSILDSDGHLVAHPFDRAAALGEYHVTWDRRSQRGAALPSGVYLYRLRSGGETLHGRMVLLNPQYVPSDPADDLPDARLFLLPGPWR